MLAKAAAAIKGLLSKVVLYWTGSGSAKAWAISLLVNMADIGRPPPNIFEIVINIRNNSVMLKTKFIAGIAKSSKNYIDKEKDIALIEDFFNLF